MVDILFYDQDTQEQDRIESQLSNSVALLSDERLSCRKYNAAEQVEGHLKADAPYDLSLLEVTSDSDIELTRKVRHAREQSDMMLIADVRIPVMKIVTPETRVCSLLQKPYEEKDMKEVVRDFMAAFFRSREVPTDSNSIVIENRQGRRVIPFSHIYYVEAREKKVHFRLRDREYSVYESLDNISRRLPATFIKCHRSFMFNTAYLDRVKLSENIVYLEHGIMVPLSRSYKPSIKEYISGLSGNRDSNNE